MRPKCRRFVSFASSEGGRKTMLFSQTSASRQSDGNPVIESACGRFFFLPLPSRWASAIAVWLLRVWCSRNVPDIDVKLPGKWFHIRAFCVTDLGAGSFSALWEDSSTLTVSPLVRDSFKCILPGSAPPHGWCYVPQKFFFFFFFYLRWDSCCLLSFRMIST